MCLSVPGRVISIKDNEAVVDYAGEKRTAKNLFINDLKTNDYVLVQNGFIVEKISKEKAIKSIGLWKNAGRKNES